MWLGQAGRALEGRRYGSLKNVSTPTTHASPGYLTVDLDALARNYHSLQAMAAPAECGAVVKANGYGLGMAPVAGRLSEEGCRHFFVASANEGASLREVLPEARIYVFEGVLEGGEASLLEANLIPVLNSLDQIRRWKAVGGGRTAVVQIDTGMSRLGLSAREVEEASATGLLDGIDLDCVATHLACADEPSHRLNSEQLERFETLRRKLPEAKTSIGSSPGTLFGPASRGDLVRPGIALYGGNPFVSGDNPMEAVATLEAVILQIREVTEPVTVGYGATFTAEPPTRLATVSAGYADGYPRSLSQCGVGFLAGTEVPVVGRVSMDMITLDVSAVAPEAARPGDLVELVGPNVPLEDVAAAAGTINYEILTGLGSRWRRRYLPA